MDLTSSTPSFNKRLIDDSLLIFSDSQVIRIDMSRRQHRRVQLPRAEASRDERVVVVTEKVIVSAHRDGDYDVLSFHPKHVDATVGPFQAKFEGIVYGCDISPSGLHAIVFTYRGLRKTSMFGKTLGGPGLYRVDLKTGESISIDIGKSSAISGCTFLNEETALLCLVNYRQQGDAYYALPVAGTTMEDITVSERIFDTVQVGDRLFGLVIEEGSGIGGSYNYGVSPLELKDAQLFRLGEPTWLGYVWRMALGPNNSFVALCDDKRNRADLTFKGGVVGEPAERLTWLEELVRSL